MSAKYERELVDVLTDRGYHATRTAGSMGECDVTIIKPYSHKGWICEVKKTPEDTWYVKGGSGGNSKDQFDHYKRLADDGFNVIYGIRITYGPWVFFPMQYQLSTDDPEIFRKEQGTELDSFFSEVDNE